ncbi:MerR family transcriptional regulator [Promicromonospora iranensis]|uniref:DNA-binding transcriptional MerR regulator n=1 Tax=Promicromonospora iranensis TaxID=1105144 RepID=A0ABU2CMD9_9MICO|nr:MerR family transcriptional regulator [Promicromonospora iranensis]MDR7382509.1 DNA-binding transcriptional MerR regulator [Promicromonospora iranensis]
MTSSRPAQSSGGSRASSPGLAVAAVARRLGVAPATLRTWDRRYGLGPSGRTAGSHRRYTPDDVARLLVMRRLTLEGVAPVDAARAAVEAGEAELEAATRTAPALPAVEVEADSEGAGPEFAETFLGTVEAPTEPGAEDPPGGKDGEEPKEEPRGRARLRALPGGATGGDAPAAAGPRAASGAAPAPTSGRVSALVDAALAYSRTACDNLLALGPEGDPATWWTDLVEPAWLRLSERTVLAGPGEMPEVVLATAALRALRHYTEEFERVMVEAGGPPANHPSRMRKIVLVFAAPDEVVPLSAHALAAALAAQGSMARIVTGPASTHRSVELVTMVRPTAVVLATTQNKPDLDVVHAVNEAYPELPIFVGLRADAAATDLPFGPTVQRVRSFTGLLHEVLAVIKAR